MPSNHQHFCLAIERNGLPCVRQPQSRGPPGDRPRGRVSNTNFCLEHASEYRDIIDQYTRARIRCQKARWLFNTSLDDLNSRSPSQLTNLEKNLNEALESLTLALDIRILRCQRFAAAYDEFANDENADTLVALKEHCFALLQHCLPLLPAKKNRSCWGLWWFLLGPSFVMKNHSREARIQINSKRPTAREMKQNDSARKYFGSFGPGLQFVKNAQSVPPAPVSSGIRDPVKAASIARKQTFRNRLASFLIAENQLTSQVGHALLADIQSALYSRVIVKDQVLLAKSKRKPHMLYEFLDDDCVTADDLERLWMSVYHINPAVMKDALHDLEDLSLDRPSVRTLGIDIALTHDGQLLSPQGWDVLYLLLGDTLSFSDLVFLSASAQELLDISIYTAFHHTRYKNMLTYGSTGTDSLLLCMRALGFLITWSDPAEARGTIVGIMVDDELTKKFIRLISATDDYSVWLRSSSGVVSRNDHILSFEQPREIKYRKRNNQDPIRINIETNDGDIIDCLHHRLGDRFADGCEVRIAPRSQIEGDRDTWKLGILQALTKAKFGHRDVCKALDAVLDEVKRRARPRVNRMKVEIVQTPQGEVVQRLKQHYSSVSIASTLLPQRESGSERFVRSGRRQVPRRATESKGPPVPSKLRQDSLSDCSSFESCSDLEVDTPDSSVHPLESSISFPSLGKPRKLSSVAPRDKAVLSPVPTMVERIATPPAPTEAVQFWPTTGQKTTSQTTAVEMNNQDLGTLT